MRAYSNDSISVYEDAHTMPTPQKVEKREIKFGLLSSKEEFLDYNEAILELSPLLGIKSETLLSYFVVLQCYELDEDVFISHLRPRFHYTKCNQPVSGSKEDILSCLGLDLLCCKAWNYAMKKCSLKDNHLDITDWAVLYMQDLFCNSLFRENLFGRFPYQESTVNTWFTHSTEQEDESHREVHILNRIEDKKQKNEPYPLLEGKCFPEEIQEEGFELFYHGTDHKSAKGILEDGIDLQKGKPNRDFSHREGFYLNNNYEEARNWAFRIRNTKQAIIVFKIPKNVLDQFRQRSLNLCEDEVEWKRIVKGFRHDPTNKKFKKEMKGISFIEGPMASVAVKGSPPVKIKGTIEGSYQMCLHSHDLAEEFDFHLHSIVFF